MNPGPFRVVWKRSAVEIQIAEIVNHLISRGESVAPITRAMDLIDRALSANPTEVGESRPNFERIHTEPPLTVRFAVHEEERLVYVLGVTYLLPRHLRD